MCVYFCLFDVQLTAMKFLNQILRITFFVNIVFTPLWGLSWGQTGHRVVGEIATRYLAPEVKEKLHELLEGQSLAVVSNWMDDIKSDQRYDSLRPWHYVSIPDGKAYEASVKNPKGDIVKGINVCIEKLKEGGLDKNAERELVKILVHLMGDIHQPFHVGRKEDRGGNDVKVKWFWSSSNLHRVWDSGMIDSKNYSYTELANALYVPNEEEIEKWQHDSMNKWIRECMQLRPAIYDLPADNEINYAYRYAHWDTVKMQLLKGGIRLAGVLNQIYGQS